jgi:membrane protein DedA with SNARE-associated domain
VREQFSKNAARAVFAGRFIALLRIFAGPLAGIARMPYPLFLLCNFAGAATWASVMISLAYFVGRVVSLEQLVSWVAQFAVLALFLAIASVAIPIWLESRSRRSES